ncbi:hypothetical protein Uis1B_0869 [Bifidobacterium margollesii]|uniref:Uncharacterized protein n=1 Tax=Bifidobacterium margollesii TaxID=2020964 RepID=A0A2N5JAW2_9BIFI|nr:hypothetical protein [Bifidobacterium margollesii]PLS31353.1 hypothetical protein Uis1B_0869 [Bifidobacterium margollesii]
MDFKKSMIRGMAIYGASTMMNSSMGNKQLVQDVINLTNENR